MKYFSSFFFFISSFFFVSISDRKTHHMTSRSAQVYSFFIVLFYRIKIPFLSSRNHLMILQQLHIMMKRTFMLTSQLKIVLLMIMKLFPHHFTILLVVQIVIWLANHMRLPLPLILVPKLSFPL